MTQCNLLFIYYVSKQPAAPSSEQKTFTLKMGTCSTMNMAMADYSERLIAFSESVWCDSRKDSHVTVYNGFRMIIFKFLR